MSAEKKKQRNVLGLVVALVVVLLGGVVFMGAVSGWFGSEPVTLDAEYYCGEDCDGEMMDLSGAEYEELVAEGKSFVVFIDQGGCTTADRLRGYVRDWGVSVGVKVYRMMFEDERETSLHDYVKYYPSVVVVSKGKVVAWLRADSDEDAEEYNDYEAFRGWMMVVGGAKQ